MFDNDYFFKGKHATYVKLLTAELGNDSKNKIFLTNVDVYAMAAIVGYIYNVKGERNNGNDRTNILASAFSNNKSQLISNYRMIMLLHDKTNIDLETRIARAFKYDNNVEKRKIGDDIFESYILGGVEKIFEKIFGTLNLDNVVIDVDVAVKNIYLFLEEFQLRYDNATDQTILDLCKLATD